MNVWQIIVIILYALSLGMHLAKNGEPRTGTYSFGSAFFSTALVFFALYKGGFFS